MTTYCDQLLQHFRLLKDEEKLCDVRLEYRDCQFHLHSVVLLAMCRYFEKKWRNARNWVYSGVSPFVLRLDEVLTDQEDFTDELHDFVAALYSGKTLAADSKKFQKLSRLFDVKCDFERLDPAPVEPTVGVYVSTCMNGSVDEPVKPPIVAPKKPVAKEVEMDMSICGKCDLLFMSQEEFLAHRSQKCTRKFTCRTCGAMFQRVQHLMNHLVEVRHGEIVCSVCAFVGDSQSNLESHLQRHLDDNQRPYFCLQCDSRFPNRNGLAQHMPKHSAETPFLCQVCAKGFKWKHALTTHMITHSAEKKFLCQDCGFSASHASTFKSHMRTHTGNKMKCTRPGCGFETVRKDNLIQHELTHSKEKPHQCEVCGRAFSLAKNMRRHALQHDSTATPKSCPVAKCQFRTLRTDKYLEHLKKYHPEEVAKPPTPVFSSSVYDSVNPPNRTIEVSGQDTFGEVGFLHGAIPEIGLS